MFVRRLSTVVVSAAIGGLGFTAPGFAHASAPPVAAATYAVTPGRVLGSVAALVALAGVAAGGLALARSARRDGGGRRGAVVAVVAGLIGMAGGGLVVAAAKGGPGTGYGIVGGFVALVLGLAATLLGWLALARSRRTSLTG